MKVRHGFVSNSSSSSFVIVHKPVMTNNSGYYELKEAAKNGFEGFFGTPRLELPDSGDNGKMWLDLSRATKKELEELIGHMEENDEPFILHDVVVWHGESSKQMTAGELLATLNDTAKGDLTGFTKDFVVEALTIDQCSNCGLKEVMGWFWEK